MDCGRICGEKKSNGSEFYRLTIDIPDSQWWPTYRYRVRRSLTSPGTELVRSG